MEVSCVHLCGRAQYPIVYIGRHFVGHFVGHSGCELYWKCFFNILGLVCIWCVCFLNWKIFIKINDYTIWSFGRHFGRHLEYLKMPKGDKVAPGIFLNYTTSFTRLNEEKNLRQQSQVHSRFCRTNVVSIGCERVLQVVVCHLFAIYRLLHKHLVGQIQIRMPALLEAV